MSHVIGSTYYFLFKSSHYIGARNQYNYCLICCVQHVHHFYLITYMRAMLFARVCGCGMIWWRHGTHRNVQSSKSTPQGKKAPHRSWSLLFAMFSRHKSHELCGMHTHLRMNTIESLGMAPGRQRAQLICISRATYTIPSRLTDPAFLWLAHTHTHTITQTVARTLHA